MMRFKLLGALCLSLLSLGVAAHNVVGGVYAIGDQIEGEVGFSNGDMAAPGTVVNVTDRQGNELARLETDDEGGFTYTATQRIDHLFYANLSSGHILELTLPADELPDSLAAVGSVEVTVDKVAVPSVSTTSIATDRQGLEQMIERAVAKQVVPLRKEIAAYKEKSSLQDIMGGVGYIFGLCGLGIWWRQRQLDKQQTG
jgi:nickel transport protein